MIENSGEFYGINDMSEPVSSDLLEKPKDNNQTKQDSGIHADNGNANGSDRDLTWEQREAIRRNAEAIRILGLTDERYEEFKAAGIAKASNVNGDRLSMDQIRENLRRMFSGSDKKP
jgi:hypothetical protein